MEVRAQVLDPDILQIFHTFDFAQILLDLLPQFLQFVTHVHAS